MNTASKIAEMGMINMLSQIKNPLTNIKLCLELLESDAALQNQHIYYDIMRSSTSEIESTIKDLCASFQDLGISLHVGTDSTYTNIE
ncbi:hypothetical protein BH11BAC4_BH11BAC4_06040 [soil metagenome]